MILEPVASAVVALAALAMPPLDAPRLFGRSF